MQQSVPEIIFQVIANKTQQLFDCGVAIKYTQ
jgi:hypothetical protein